MLHTVLRQNAKDILEYRVDDVRVEYYIVLSMYERKHLENDVVDVIYGHNVTYELYVIYERVL